MRESAPRRKNLLAILLCVRLYETFSSPRDAQRVFIRFLEILTIKNKKKTRGTQNTDRNAAVRFHFPRLCTWAASLRVESRQEVQGWRESPNVDISAYIAICL
jgi:hypothetical protein